MAPDATLTWVVGAGGLLGSAVVREAVAEGRPTHRTAVPWSNRELAVDVLAADAEELAARHARLQLAWCAGAGVIGTSDQDLEDEVRLLDGFLDRMRGIVGRHGTQVSMFLASSAGGVHAGSEQPPFTELTVPVAISPYGHAKLAAEESARRFADETGAHLLVGRIANLYGPGQDISKPQGLISQLCRAQLAREPLSLYVSLDTARDYIYVADAARMVLAGMDTVDHREAPASTTKILASQSPTTLAAIIGELHRLTRRRPIIVLGTSSMARFQVRDLRFRSVVLTELDALVSTPLPEGISATLSSIGRDLRAARLTG